MREGEKGKEVKGERGEIRVRELRERDRMKGEGGRGELKPIDLLVYSMLMF